MAGRVDARASVVRVGGGAIPFEVDCGRGTAVLDPAGRPRRLRLLRWREKCALARFANADPEFLERQFLVACAGAAAESDEERTDALAALAVWLHAPDGDALPLDPDLLAEATLGLCSDLALSPAALGAMAATEVEALWRAAQAASPVDAVDTDDTDDTGDTGARAPLAPGITRILIRPDPDPALSGDPPDPAGPAQTAPAVNAPGQHVTGSGGAESAPGPGRNGSSDSARTRSQAAAAPGLHPGRFRVVIGGMEHEASSSAAANGAPAESGSRSAATPASLGDDSGAAPPSPRSASPRDAGRTAALTRSPGALARPAPPVAPAQEEPASALPARALIPGAPLHGAVKGAAAAPAAAAAPLMGLEARAPAPAGPGPAWAARGGEVPAASSSAPAAIASSLTAPPVAPAPRWAGSYPLSGPRRTRVRSAAFGSPAEPGVATSTPAPTEADRASPASRVGSGPSTPGARGPDGVGVARSVAPVADPSPAAPAGAARVAPLIEIVMRASEAEAPAHDPDVLIDEIARRLAEAAAECGIARID
jgi:hypothetical protein